MDPSPRELRNAVFGIRKIRTGKIADRLCSRKTLIVRCFDLEPQRKALARIVLVAPRNMRSDAGNNRTTSIADAPSQIYLEPRRGPRLCNHFGAVGAIGRRRGCGHAHSRCVLNSIDRIGHGLLARAVRSFRSKPPPHSCRLWSEVKVRRVNVMVVSCGWDQLGFFPTGLAPRVTFAQLHGMPKNDRAARLWPSTIGILRARTLARLLG